MLELETLLILGFNAFMGYMMWGLLGFGAGLTVVCNWTIFSSLGFDAGPLRLAIAADSICNVVISIPFLFLANSCGLGDYGLFGPIAIFRNMGNAIGAYLFRALNVQLLELIIAPVLFILVILKYVTECVLSSRSKDDELPAHGDSLAVNKFYTITDSEITNSERGSSANDDPDLVSVYDDIEDPLLGKQNKQVKNQYVLDRAQDFSGPEASGKLPIYDTQVYGHKNNACKEVLNIKQVQPSYVATEKLSMYNTHECDYSVNTNKDVQDLSCRVSTSKLPIQNTQQFAQTEEYNIKQGQPSCVAIGKLPIFDSQECEYNSSTNKRIQDSAQDLSGRVSTGKLEYELDASNKHNCCCLSGDSGSNVLSCLLLHARAIFYMLTCRTRFTKVQSDQTVNKPTFYTRFEFIDKEYLNIKYTVKWLRSLPTIVIGAILSGLGGSMVGVPGPPLIYTFQLLNLPKDTARANASVANVLDLRVVFYFVYGSLDAQFWYVYVLTVVCGFVGLVVGSVLSRFLNTKQYYHFLMVQILVSAVLLLLKGTGVVDLS
eukprot:TRINITY_DN11968_c1_g2_i1.p1 TRINITY_DN11968_c1_g2~~TRINITY_DN11968_c1_g2_i1.p1  ORF type:complete len:609 (+),score=59.99 TRINITY_DN11968_c1_g2_i1:193-1827(+)